MSVFLPRGAEGRGGDVRGSVLLQQFFQDGYAFLRWPGTFKRTKNWCVDVIWVLMAHGYTHRNNGGLWNQLPEILVCIGYGLNLVTSLYRVLIDSILYGIVARSRGTGGICGRKGSSLNENQTQKLKQENSYIANAAKCTTFDRIVSIIYLYKLSEGDTSVFEALLFTHLWRHVSQAI